MIVKTTYACDGCGEETMSAQQFILRFQTIKSLGQNRNFALTVDLCPKCALPFDPLILKVIAREQEKHGS